MNLKCGLVGLPNVGKSTLFNNLTKLNVPALNFPFCTIKSNIGIVPYIDPRLNVLAKIVNSKKITYSYIKFIDIAGLVKGASKGEGLGNKFLNNIKNVNVIIHVVRCFNDNNIIHVNGVVDPLSDIRIINKELFNSDYFLCERILNNLNKKKFFSNEVYLKHFNILNKFIIFLKKKDIFKRFFLNDEENNILSSYNFLTIKPMLYLLNFNYYENNNIFLNKFKNIINIDKKLIFPVYLDVIKKDIFIKNKIKENKYFLNLIKKCFFLLNLNTFFTVGKKESKSWSFLKNSTAVNVARIIHTDFSVGFIRVKVISYKDFILYKNENNLRLAGKIRMEGKNYIVKDGDILNFLFNV